MTQHILGSIEHTQPLTPPFMMPPMAQENNQFLTVEKFVQVVQPLNNRMAILQEIIRRDLLKYTEGQMIERMNELHKELFVPKVQENVVTHDELTTALSDFGRQMVSQLSEMLADMKSAPTDTLPGDAPGTPPRKDGKQFGGDGGYRSAKR